MADRPTGYAFIATLLVLLFPQFIFGQIKRINLPETFPVVQSGSQLWVGTPDGLYQYNQTDDSYKKFAPPNYRSDFNVRYLYVYKDWLWCVMDSGLAALQMRLNDWLVFDTSNGLPSPKITGIDFQDDYVWISTPLGAAKFDLLIEQWEQYGRKRGLPYSFVTDIKSDGENIWMLTGKTLSEYSPQFEKWRAFKFSDDTSNSARRLFFFGDELWIVTDSGLVRFNPVLQQYQEYFLPYLTDRNLIEMYLEGDRLWTVSHNGLYSYEQQSGVWTAFEGNTSLKDLNIKFGIITQEQIWILTDNVTMVWDRNLKTWEKLDYSTGLSQAFYNSVYSDGDLTLLFTSNIIEYRKTRQDNWRKFSIESSGTGRAAGNIFGRMFDNPEGGSLALGDYLWNWQGTRATYIQENSTRLNGATSTSQSNAWRLDIKSQLELGRGRRVTGFYDNMDYTETKYGARFRGNDSDYVREVIWGDFRRDQGTVPFGQAAELFGTNIWLQAGPKTERFKRSFVSLKATTGEIRSKKTYEKFRGASAQFSLSIQAGDFLKNQFFLLAGTDSIHQPDGLEIFVDDSIVGDNNLKTLTGATIAGITGDFDPLIPAEEFYYYKRGGKVRLLYPVASNCRIVARYRVGNVFKESVLQDGQYTTAQNNFYSLGAQGILPFSFTFNIEDTAGNPVSINRLGIDDGTGRADSRWIDYDAGILMLPNSANSNSNYIFNIRGQTERTIILLGHRNLVRASETLRLDDTPAEPGNDFVLDYTNGTLIFVREGIVNPDTRIEIDYEYYESTGNQLASASLNVAPSDQLYVQGDWQKLSNDSTHLFGLHGELRQKVGSFDVRFIPGVVYQTNENKLTGTSVEALISSGWLRLQSKYEHYDSGYKNIFRNQSVVGDVNRRFNIYGSLDVREDLRFTGEWKQTEGFAADSINVPKENPIDKIGNVTILYHGTDLPAAQLTYQDGSTKFGDSTESKQFLQGNLEYQFPKSWISALNIKGIKAEYFLRSGLQTENYSSGLLKQEFLQTYYKLNAMISEQFQAGLFYRRNTLDDASSGSTNNPITASNRLLGDIEFAEWRFIQVNARLENTLQQDFYRSGDSLTYYSSNFYQVNMRLSPGQLWNSLSSLFFEVTYNQTAAMSDVSPASAGPSVWRINAPDYYGSGSYVVSRNTFLKNEFRPDANWLISSLVEWNTQHSETGITSLERSSWQLTEKADVRPGYTTHLIAQYRRVSQDLGFGRSNNINEPSIWIEQRWTDDLLNTAQIIYRRTVLEDRTISAALCEWEGLLDFVLRKDQWLGMRHVEIHQSFSGSNQRQEGIPILQANRLGATTSLDLYPLYSLIIRLRFDWNRFTDEIVSAASYSTINFTMKLSLQL